MTMPKLDHLLAATDLSAPSRHAVERAAMLSRETGASLDLLHVVDRAPLERLRELMLDSPDGLQERVLGAARERLGELAETLRERFGVSAGARVAAGPVLAELARQVDETAADLIVCGARGESYVRHSLLGSTAARMLGKATRPMLVVKQVPHDRYGALLVPGEFSRSSGRAAWHARSVAPKADIALLHAFEVPFEGHLRYARVDEATIHHHRVVARQDATRKLLELAGEAGLPPHAARLVVTHGDPSLRIVEQEQELNCDLIVIGKHGQNVVEELFLGSVTRHVLAESQGDVLVSV